MNPKLLFIKRADAVGDPWSGHMAFPGGRYEVGDQSLLETAVRETREETAIDIRRPVSCSAASMISRRAARCCRAS
jgi:8-oxo-dGTP pyrophosphatase MutT (NUDIX family)